MLENPLTYEPIKPELVHERALEEILQQCTIYLCITDESWNFNWT